MFIYTKMSFRYNLSTLTSPYLPLYFNTSTTTTHMKNILFISATLVALGGCASAEKTYLHNGQQGLTIDCSGGANSWETCYEKADSSCAGTGYDIIGTDGTPSPKPSDKTLGADVGNYKSRSVVVVCK